MNSVVYLNFPYRDSPFRNLEGFVTSAYMPKLHLKRTPAEEAEHAQRKARKTARKEAKRRHRVDLSETSDRSKRQTHSGQYKHVGEEGYSNIDDDLLWNEEVQRMRREENEWFQQRMWDELGEQERLDNLESNFNSYSHIPYRWRSSAPEDPRLKADPQLMEEEEYVEWIRDGMWRCVLIKQIFTLFS
jgi:hypothetical protein